MCGGGGGASRLSASCQLIKRHLLRRCEELKWRRERRSSISSLLLSHCSQRRPSVTPESLRKVTTPSGSPSPLRVPPLHHSSFTTQGSSSSHSPSPLRVPPLHIHLHHSGFLLFNFTTQGSSSSPFILHPPLTFQSTFLKHLTGIVMCITG